MRHPRQRERAPVRDRRNHREPRHHAIPRLEATAPNQVWSWDITKLLTFQKWTYLYLYVLLDIFSRYVVGWLLAHGESATLAAELIKASCRRQGISQNQLTIHSDRGPAMRSKTLGELYDDLAIVRSHSRPHVSNDNPFSESQFKTMKYQPEFPDRFGLIEDGRAFCRRFFPWHNTEHRHSAIAHLPPAAAPFGRAQQALDRRHAVVLEQARRHPERFLAGLPKRLLAPSAVWINPPTEKIAREVALQSPISPEAVSDYLPKNNLPTPFAHDNTQEVAQ